MLNVSKINASYGKVQVLRELSLEVKAGEILCLLGLVPVSAGTIHLEGQEISALPAYKVPKLGIGYIPQGRRLFSEMTVLENLQIGLMTRGKGADTLEMVLEMFPRLRERLHQPAQTLSGGEQQMLATARALCLEPKVLLLDEPTEGLQPSMIALIRDAVVALKKKNVAIILVEQRVEAVLEIADNIVFVENGRSALTVTPAQLHEDRELLHRYVGV